MYNYIFYLSIISLNLWHMQIIIFLIILFISSFSISAQNINFKHLTIQDGLSQSTINCIFQDSKGYMWIGTQDGLNKYDGYDFTIYKENPIDTNSISHNWIWNIFEDNQMNLWIATWNGLTKYKPDANLFIRYFSDTTKTNSISGERPTSICQDKQGNIWIGTWGGGINKYIYSEDRFISYQHNPKNVNSIPNNFVRSVYNDIDNTIWVGTWEGLSKLQSTSNNTVKITNFINNSKNLENTGHNRITSILRDKSGVLWIGTLGGGLKKFNEVENEFVTITNISNNSLSINHNDVSAIYEDKSQNLWIGTIGGGLNKLDRERKNIIYYKHQPDNSLSLSSDKIFSIYEDNSGLMWIGSNGLNIYDKNLEKFSHIFRSQNNNSLNNNKVWAFCEDFDKNIWIGTEGGLNKYISNTNTFLSYKHIAGNIHYLSNNNVNSIVNDNFGNLWIGTRGGGLNKFDTKTGEFSTFNQSMSLENTDGIDYILSLCIDHEILWIAPFGKGLIKYDMNRKKFYQYLTNPKNENSISGNYINTIFKDSRGDIWIGGWGAGLCRYDRNNNHFIRYLHFPGNPNSLVGNIVNTIYEYKSDSERILCVGTNNGLSLLDLRGDNLNYFTNVLEQDGLPSNVIYGILTDNSNNLWLSTNKGLSKFNMKDRTFRNYTFYDGLQSNEFNSASCLKRENGQLLFGGVNGFNIFYPDSIKDNLFVPPIVITSFKVFDKPYLNSQNSTDEINLSYEQNFFSFEFAALDYSQHGKIKYAYKMEGFDEDWIYSDTRRYVSYTNLDPGEYKFKAKGTNSDGIWMKNPKIVNINISPPFWQTFWFRMVAIICLLILLYNIYKYRVTKLLEIERLRVRIASDLHDDIGSALTRISVHSEIIQNSEEKNTVKNSSKKIGIMSREIITTMSDIVWSIDARNDLIKNLIDRMKDFSTGLLVEKDIQLKFSHKGLELNKKLPIHIRQNLFLIFKEAINNIYKHSNASVVKVNLSNAQREFKMKITDDGDGYNPALIKNGNGLKNMQMRAERIGAQIEMNTNNGVEILLTLSKI